MIFFRLFRFESRHRFGYGEIRFARARGTDAEYDGIFIDGFGVTLLPQRFALDFFTGGGGCHDAVEQFFGFFRFARFCRFDTVQNLTFVDPLAFFRRARRRFQRFFAQDDVLFFAADFQS